MPTQAAPIAALESSQDGPLAAEARLVSLRSQVAIVRMLADQVEQLSRAADVDGLGAQLVEETARLGCRLLDAAAALAGVSPVEDSGVFKRAATLGTAHWETPRYDLVRMDAEIGSYQEDDERVGSPKPIPWRSGPLGSPGPAPVTNRSVRDNLRT